jgi:hypothetical protein
MDQNVLTVAWNGQAGSRCELLRRQRRRSPVNWGAKPVVMATLGQNPRPSITVSGIRRMSTQQADPLKAGVELTPAVIAKNRQYAFGDAPLVMKPAQIIGPPRASPTSSERVVSHHVVQREDGRRRAGGDISGVGDGHLPAICGSLSIAAPTFRRRAATTRGGIAHSTRRA